VTAIPRALSVLTVGNRLKVVRVDAALHAAEVIEQFPWRDGADEEFVDDAMGHLADALPLH